MSKTDQVAASNYFDEAIWPLVQRAIGDRLDVRAKENIADALSGAFLEALNKEAVCTS
jgi:hypothetical protein